jgi:hypothetical protein
MAKEQKSVFGWGSPDVAGRLALSALHCPKKISFMTIPPLNVMSLITSVAGAIAVMVWRVRESRTAVSAKKIIIPPMGMAKGFSMFVVPRFAFHGVGRA